MLIIEIILNEFFQLTNNSASIVVKNSQRQDGGQYRLQLKNPAGFDTATLHVRVLDRPHPPENLHADEFAGMVDVCNTIYNNATAH